MPLTKEQIDFLQRYIREIEESPTREGEVVITVKNGHVRAIFAGGMYYFPKP